MAGKKEKTCMTTAGVNIISDRKGSFAIWNIPCSPTQTHPFSPPSPTWFSIFNKEKKQLPHEASRGGSPHQNTHGQNIDWKNKQRSHIEQFHNFSELLNRHFFQNLKSKPLRSTSWQRPPHVSARLLLLLGEGEELKEETWEEGDKSRTPSLPLSPPPPIF